MSEPIPETITTIADPALRQRTECAWKAASKLAAAVCALYAVAKRWPILGASSFRAVIGDALAAEVAIEENVAILRNLGVRRYADSEAVLHRIPKVPRGPIDPQQDSEYLEALRKHTNALVAWSQELEELRIGLRKERSEWLENRIGGTARDDSADTDAPAARVDLLELAETAAGTGPDDRAGAAGWEARPASEALPSSSPPETDAMGRMPTIEETVAILEGKRNMVLAAMIAADKGTNEPRGYQAQGNTREESIARGVAWVQGRADADFQIPSLRFWFNRLRYLGVTKLPPWTGEPNDETKALELLDGLIAACREALVTTRPTNLTAGIESAALTPAADTEPDAGQEWLTCPDLAARYGVDQEALRGRLRTWMKTNQDGWKEVTEHGPREPKYIYRLAGVLHIVRSLQARR